MAAACFIRRLGFDEGALFLRSLTCIQSNKAGMTLGTFKPG